MAGWLRGVLLTGPGERFCLPTSAAFRFEARSPAGLALFCWPFKQASVRRVFKLGDKVEVQVAKVDTFKKQVDFKRASSRSRPG